MRTVLLVGIAMTVIAVSVFGVRGCTSHLTATRDTIVERVNDALGKEHAFRRFRLAQQTDYKRLENYCVQVALREEECNKLAEQTEALKSQLAGHQAVLPKALEILEQNKNKPKTTEVVIGSEKYTLSDVQQDLQYRVRMCRELEKQIAANSRHIATLRQSVHDHKQKIREIRQSLKEREKKAKETMDAIRFEELEAERLAMEESLRSLGQNVASDSSESTKMLALLERQKTMLHTRNAVRAKRLGDMATGANGNVIDWAGKTTTIDEARAYLNKLRKSQAK